jgi:hypothetical protein
MIAEPASRAGAVAETMAEGLRAAGLAVESAGLQAAAQRSWWDRLDAELVVLPDAARLPATARDGLVAFLGRGGKLIGAGGPLLGDPLFQAGGAWLTAARLEERRRATPPRRPFVELGEAETARWRRTSDRMAAPSRLAVEAGDHGPSLRLDVRGLQGWDTFARSFDRSPFGAGETLTCFWARGGRPADHLAVEWQERDGSRWIASVPLGPGWQHYALPPREFLYWPDSSTEGRGSAGDRFHPGAAARLSLGFAASHRAAPGDHTAWIAELGSAPDPFPGAEAQAEPPRLTAFSPAYQLYPLRDVATIVPPGGGPAWSGVPHASLAPLPRHDGSGFAAGRSERLRPLLLARDRAGQSRGLLAWEVAHAGPPYPGAAWLAIGTTDDEFWRRNHPALVALLRERARWLAGGVALLAGGSDRFTAYPDEPFAPGAKILNLAPRPQTARVEVTLRRAGDPQAGPLVRRAETVSLAPHAAEEARWAGTPLRPGRSQVTVELTGGDPGLRDTLAHELVVEPRPEAGAADRVTVQGGHFQLHGRRWFALGVNFWPRSQLGTEPDEYRRPWLDPAAYEPAIVEQDLETARQLGMNCVSVQYTSPDQALPLRDFLRRCRAKGILANLYLAGAHPLHFEPDKVRQLIQAADLAREPAVFAYDLAWEPVWGRQEERRRYDPEWRAWLVRRYGDVGRAEAAWAGWANHDPAGQATSPTDEQVTTDGAWRKMVADYRRFQDDLLDERYAAVRRLIRSLDAHALLGARTGWGGGPFVNSPMMPFDHASGARQLDFISPEGWNLRGDRPEGTRAFERGAFIPAYDRLVSGGKPVFWAEFGYDCGYPLPGITAAGSEPPAQAELEQQRRHYENFYRLVRLSDADGAMAWWLPGGYRLDERSDFGLLNPDGTPRPAAAELRRFAAQAAPPAPPPPETWLTVDRFADARGPWALWQKDAPEYARLLRQGHRVGLRNVRE